MRHNRDYRRLWLGQAVSLVGDEIFDTALMLWLGLVAAGDQAWGPAAAAGVLVARTAPVLLFGVIGGVYSDRWDRRRTMLAMDAVRATLIAGLALLLLIGLPTAAELTAIYVVVALCSVAALFFNPARYGMLATVVADADRERMGSLTAGTSALATVLGPSLAAGMLVVASVEWSLLFTAAMFVVSFAAVRALPSGTGVPTSGSVWRELRAGLVFFAGNRRLKVMLTTTVTVVAGVGAINTLDIFFVTRNLGAPVEVYGLLGTAFGLGSLVGAGLAAVYAPRLRAHRVYGYGFTLAGLLLVVYSRMSEPVGAIVVLFLVGIPVAAVNSMVGPLIMRAAPAHLIGRVSGVLQPATQLAMLLSVTASAWLAGLFPIGGIFMAAGVLIAVVGVWAARHLSP
nr:MFS transporter [Kibdelosporangium sp. MJ126-NF4]